MVQKVTQITGIDVNELKAIINTSIAEQLQFLKSSNKEDIDILLSIKETCAFLKISKTTLWRLEKNGKIFPRRLNTRVVYLKAELLTFLKNTTL